MGRSRSKSAPEADADEGAGFQIVFRPLNLLPRLQPEYVIDALPATIGRHPSNDIELPFDSVSRFHARLEMGEGEPKITDLRSSNGTFVNGRRVQTARLRDQDVVTFGGVGLAVTLVPSGAAALGRRQRSASESGTSVHLVADAQPVVESVIDADLPEDTSSVPSIEEEITDAEALRQAKERLVSLYRLQEILRSTTDEKKLLRRTLQLLFQALPVERGVVLTRDRHDPNVFNPIATKVRNPRRAGQSIGISKTILSRCLKEKVALLTRDATTDSRFNQADSIIAHGIRSAMCAPLLAYQHVAGFVHLDTSQAIRSFTRDDLAFVTNVGVEVAIHIQNIRMLQERILQERMAAIGQTITGLAHNIKNVLLLSQGAIDLMGLRLENKNYEALGETWQMVKRGIDRINKMVKDMLDYARARTAEKTRCQVNELLSELRQTFAGEMEKRGIDCRLALDSNCPPVLVDADGLDKAVVNLLLNAIEACPDGRGEITLRTRYHKDQQVQIEVEDNAGGIPDEVLPRIFFPFFTTKGSKGSGLGLAVTKKFVEDMGGRIEVKTEEGMGSIFTITLPLDQGEIRLETPTPLAAGD